MLEEIQKRKMQEEYEDDGWIGRRGDDEVISLKL